MAVDIFKGMYRPSMKNPGLSVKDNDWCDWDALTKEFAEKIDSGVFKANIGNWLKGNVQDIYRCGWNKGALTVDELYNVLLKRSVVK